MVRKIVYVIEDVIYVINGFHIKTKNAKTPNKKFGEAKYLSYLNGIIKNKRYEKVH